MPESGTITLVFVDFTRKECCLAEAEKLCSDPQISGRIVDALTPDTALQNRLRLLIDRD